MKTRSVLRDTVLARGFISWLVALALAAAPALSNATSRTSHHHRHGSRNYYLHSYSPHHHSSGPRNYHPPNHGSGSHNHPTSSYRRSSSTHSGRVRFPLSHYGRGGSDPTNHSSHSGPTYESGGTRYYSNERYKTTGLPEVDRSESAKMQFLRGKGYSRVPPGYEVDHIVPLSEGGRDVRSNMQLLTKAQHHQKTAGERRRHAHHGSRRTRRK